MPTAGQLIINEALPAKYRDPNRVLDKGGLKKLLTEIAQNDPDIYSEVLGKLGRMGAQFASRTGGYSLSTDQIQTPAITQKFRKELQQKLKSIYANDNLSSAQKDDLVIKATMDNADKMRTALKADLRENETALGLMEASGAKGNTFALAAGVGYDGLYEGPGGKGAVPYPVLHNYAEGLNPFEYWAGSFGARRGVINPKLMTAASGFLNKQLVQATHKLVVSRDDAEGEPRYKNIGLPATTDDSDNIGRYLAADIGGYRRNTLITDAVLKDLQRQKITDLLVRSPIVGGPADGSLYGYDIGLNERGRRYVNGENVGVTKAQGLGQAITQGALCLAEGTLVRMADFTTKKIEDIVAGDMVMGVDSNFVTYPVKVLQRYDQGLKKCIDTRFNKSHSATFAGNLISTEDHKVLANKTFNKGLKTSSEHNKVDAYRIGDICRSYTAITTAGTYNFNGVKEPMALLIGFLLGDGAYSNRHISLSCFDPSLLTEIEPYVESFNCVLRKRDTGQYAICKKTHTGVRNKVSHPVRQKLIELGIDRKTHKNKSIPLTAYGWDKNSLAQLISGLVVTDGWISLSKKSVSIGFGSTSEILSNQLKEILETYFSIRCTAVSQKVDKRKETYCDMFSFAICTAEDILLFSKEIQLYGIKKEKLKAAIERLQVRPVNIRDKDHKRGLTRVSQVPVGERKTYDLEVDSDNHLFVLANGLIVHNSSKHTGGVFGGESKAISGFKNINNMLQSPSTWEGAVHSQQDGKVAAIDTDEIGNTIVTVNGEQHIIPRTNKVIVKKGDEIEAGDQLSDGLPNPTDLVKFKGIGEGRRAYVSGLAKAFKEGGINTARRNIEFLAKGLIDHIEIEQEHDNYLIGDTVSYAQYENSYRPREGANRGRPDYVSGQYLEEPVLHYTIGTKLRPSVLKNLKKFGVNEVVTHPDPPRFMDQFVRAMANVSKDASFLTRFGGSYQKRSIIEGAQRGIYGDPFGPSFYDAMIGRKDFTKQLPGQPDPVIKSILPQLPQKNITAPNTPLDPGTQDWLNYDGTKPQQTESNNRESSTSSFI